MSSNRGCSRLQEPGTAAERPTAPDPDSAPRPLCPGGRDRRSFTQKRHLFQILGT